MIENILFDFDGVILDSMPIREYGFREVFKKYESSLVEKLIEFHIQNGGLSRYVKIKYFFEELLSQEVSGDEINEIANQFSKIMKQKLCDKKYLIQDTLNFIKINHKNFKLHIVSGSDESELQFLCNELSVSTYFLSIQGSPTPKIELVNKLLNKYNYGLEQTILIGDSINDYEAAIKNKIEFYAYNNEELKGITDNYIEDFNSFKC